MKKKKFFVASSMLVIFCIALFAGLVKANTTYGQGVDLTESQKIGNGSISNPQYILGSSPDQRFAQIYGGNTGDGGMIAVVMDTRVNAGSTIAIDEYSQAYYSSTENIYVANNTAGPWTEVGTVTLDNWSGESWQYFYPSVSFTCILVVGYDYGDSCNLLIDCVTTT
jgi:hypothetical protein